MIKKKKITVFFITIAMMFSFANIFAEDFASNEAYYKNLCSSDSAKNNRVTCQRYNNYLNDKVSNSQSNVEKYKGEISKYNADLAKQKELADEYQEMIVDYESDISSLESDITNLKANIVRIENEIIEREAEIAEKDRIIVERMIKTQSDIRFGYEIDFLFKAQDFATLIASASVVNDIMDFEAIQIEEINQLIEEQKTSQESLLVQQETIELNILEIEQAKADVLVLQAEVEVAIKNYQAMVAEMEAKQNASYADANALKKQIANNTEAMNKIDEIDNPGGGGNPGDGGGSVTPSTGFVRPIAGGRISARVWAYDPPWGATHLGYDYAAGVGTTIRAAANGVVIASSNSCPTYGYLGNTCGYPGLQGGGNQVHLVVSVNNTLYGINYLHMEAGSAIATGTVVSAGQTIGRLGTSGNSTGPHTHVEVIYLGQRSLSSYINSWNGNLWHNVGSSLSNRCSVKGFNAPCRVDPGDVFGRN